MILGITTPEVKQPTMQLDSVSIDRVINNDSTSYQFESERQPGVVIPSNTLGTVTQIDLQVEVCDQDPFLELIRTKKGKCLELRDDTKLYYGYVSEYDSVAAKEYYSISFTFVALQTFDISDIPTLPRV